MRRITALVTTAAATLLPLAVVVPAQAAASPSAITLTCVGNGGLGTRVDASPSPMVYSAAPGDTITVTNNTGQLLTPPTLGNGYSATYNPSLDGNGRMPDGSVATVTVGNAGDSFQFLGYTPGSCTGYSATIFVSFNAAPTPPSPPSSEGSAAPAPVLETLSLSVAASGASCTGGNPTGYSGTWMTLPKADACTQSGPNAKPGAKLLGWSPNASFPVDVAQNQIAKGWGVYDGPIGGVRMIFIPAGMSTFVSGSNTLYPVWSA